MGYKRGSNAGSYAWLTQGPSKIVLGINRINAQLRTTRYFGPILCDSLDRVHVRFFMAHLAVSLAYFQRFVPPPLIMRRSRNMSMTELAPNHASLR
jgi:hypothetical protein